MPESMRGLPAAAGAALLLGLAALLRGRAAEAPRGFVQAVWAPQASPASLGASRPRPWAAPAEAPSPRACGPAAGAALGAAALAAAAAGLARRRSGTTARRASKIALRQDQVIPWYDRLVQPKTDSAGVGVWAEKLNMTTVFQPNGETIPATILVIKRGGNVVTDKKWPERHGGYRVEVGYNRYVAQDWEMKNAGGRGGKINRLAAADLPPLQKIKSWAVRPQEWIKYEVGQKIVVSEKFKEGDVIDIHGVSKEKGFASSIKRWGHHRGPMTHGSKHHRRVGSLGGGTGTARLFPGRKMPAHQGGFPCKTRTKILKIIDNIDEDNMPETMIVVKGHVPGFTAHWKEGGSFVYFNHPNFRGDGRFKRDPVWMWYVQDEKDDPYVPIPAHAWTMKAYWGRDMRWLSEEKWKYWPDGFPGYDHSHDPFFEDCDPRKSVKAPEW